MAKEKASGIRRQRGRKRGALTSEEERKRGRERVTRREIYGTT